MLLGEFKERNLTCVLTVLVQRKMYRKRIKVFAFHDYNFCNICITLPFAIVNIKLLRCTCFSFKLKKKKKKSHFDTFINLFLSFMYLILKSSPAHDSRNEVQEETECRLCFIFLLYIRMFCEIITANVFV